MLLNVAEFALRVTGAIGIDAATANSATSTEYALFLSWLNEGVVEFMRKTKIYKQTASLAVTANKGDYAIPSSILAFEDVTYTPASGQEGRLEQVDSDVIRENRIFLTDSSSDPKYFAYEGQQILLYPKPRSSSDTIHILYVPRPSALATTADTPSTIPAEYHWVVEEYVKYRAAQHANDAASQNGQSFKQAFEEGVVNAKMAEQRKAGMVTGGVRIGRGPNWRQFAAPGVDQGY